MLTYLHIAELSRKPDVCALCEEYTAKAIEYLNEKKTQSEIIDILHNSCHQLRSFEQQVGHLVDLLCFGLGTVVVVVLNCEKPTLLSSYAF